MTTESSDEVIKDMDSNEEKVPYSFDEILNFLNDEKELILTIPADQEDDLRSGLQARKSKVNQSLKRKGMEPPKETLTFNSYPAKDSQGKVVDGIICVKVVLKERASVDIIKMEVPDKDF